ncbi:MAG: BMP family ABC transporter substrate-binding protein [Oscillospiraceae bacterium]|nr:BMP family ABC transporter substrate-binding protein [Oscillospiraceae bacterium]
MNKLPLRLTGVIMSLIIMLISLSSCSGGEGGDSPADSSKSAFPEVMKVALLASSESDVSYDGMKPIDVANELWEALRVYVSYSDISKCSVERFDADNEKYTAAFNILYAEGYRYFVAYGSRFSEAIGEAQSKYPDCKFVLFGDAPTDESGEPAISKNTICVSFDVYSAAFLAGVYTASELEKGTLGFIGGDETATANSYLRGFTDGLSYAKEQLGCKVTLSENMSVFIGDSSDIGSAQQLAAAMYDSGITAVYCTSGDFSLGVISEAKARSANGKPAFVILSETYGRERGVYNEVDSVILTSAYIDYAPALEYAINSFLDGNFEGGRSLVFGVKETAAYAAFSNQETGANTAANVETAKNYLENLLE